LRELRSRPAEAYTAIKYQDYWYWIDEGDFLAKGIFTSLMVIMTLAEMERRWRRSLRQP
jgi:hypothetical protein